MAQTWLQRAAAGVAASLQRFAGAADASPGPPLSREARAVMAACTVAGVPADQMAPSYSLLSAGKLPQVLTVAAESLGVAPPVATVADVVALFEAK